MYNLAAINLLTITAQIALLSCRYRCRSSALARCCSRRYTEIDNSHRQDSLQYRMTWKRLCDIVRLNYKRVLGMTLNCIHIFIVTGGFLYWWVMRQASQCFFIHSCIYLWILIIFLCWCAVKQSINQSINCKSSFFSKLLLFTISK